MMLKRLISSGGKPVIIHLNTNRFSPPSPIDHPARQIIHRVAFGGLHEMVGIANDMVRMHGAGAKRAIGILTATKPNRLPFQPQHNALMDIKRPTVIACQPRHIRRVTDDQNLQPAAIHFKPCLAHSLGKFLTGKIKFRRDHFILLRCRADCFFA